MDNLKKIKIKDLTEKEKENRINFLLTQTDDYIIDYLLYLFNNEYTTSSIEASFLNKNIHNDVENFIADRRFINLRPLLLKKINNKN